MIANALEELYNGIISFVQYIFDAIFGGWNWQVLFGWLPSDFLTTCTFLILFFFAIMLIKFIRNLLPF